MLSISRPIFNCCDSVTWLWTDKKGVYSVTQTSSHSYQPIILPDRETMILLENARIRYTHKHNGYRAHLRQRNCGRAFVIWGELALKILKKTKVWNPRQRWVMMECLRITVRIVISLQTFYWSNRLQCVLRWFSAVFLFKVLLHHVAKQWIFSNRRFFWKDATSVEDAPSYHTTDVVSWRQQGCRFIHKLVHGFL